MLHDANDTPDSIRIILADYTEAKIQSGVGGDVALMRKLGLGVRGVVDSGALFMLVKPGTIEQGFGAKHQIKAIWPDEGKLSHHQPYDYKSFGPALDKQKITSKVGRHIIQDVLTPFGTLFNATIKQAEWLKYQDKDDVFPLLNEALELCYSKSPLDIRQQPSSKDPHWYWFPQIENSEFRLNSREMIALIRRARGDL